MIMSWLWVFHSVQPLLLHQPVHFLVYLHDWVPNKIVLFYFSVHSISPRHPRPKHDRCAGVLLPVEYVFLIIGIMYDIQTISEPAGWHVARLCVYGCLSRQQHIRPCDHPSNHPYIETDGQHIYLGLDVVEKSLEYQWIGVDFLYNLQTIYNYWWF